MGGFAKSGGSEPTLRKITWLRWLAVIPIVIAMPFLFFGLIWWDLIILVGLVLLAAAAGIWILFAEDD